MKRINCCQKKSYERIQLGMSFDAFEKHWSPEQSLTKHNLIAWEDTFACFLNGAEFIFELGVLQHVEIREMHLFFAEPKVVYTNLTLDKTIQCLQVEGWHWKVYEAYTKDQWIVIYCDEVSFEFTLISNQLRLKVIRVGKIDDKII